MTQPNLASWARVATAVQALRHGIVNWVLLIAGLANLAAGTLYAVAGSTALAATGLGAGLILLMASTVERFELLKGLGIEAKTRALTKTIDEADQRLRSLKEVTQLTAPMLIQLAAGAGRWDSAPTPKEFYEMGRTIRRVLVEVGADDNTVRQALAPWARTIALDAASAVSSRMQGHLQKKGDSGAMVALQNAANNELSGVTTPSECADALLRLANRDDLHLTKEDQKQIQSEAKHWAAEFRHLESKMDLREPDAWFELIGRD